MELMLAVSPPETAARDRCVFVDTLEDAKHLSPSALKAEKLSTIVVYEPPQELLFYKDTNSVSGRDSSGRGFNFFLVDQDDSAAQAAAAAPMSLAESAASSSQPDVIPESAATSFNPGAEPQTAQSALCGDLSPENYDK